MTHEELEQFVMEAFAKLSIGQLIMRDQIDELDDAIFENGDDRTITKDCVDREWPW